MQKMSILFVMGSLNPGGAEKSLTSLLNALPPERYDIDLMLLRKEGLFLPLVPEHINIIDAPLEFGTLAHSPKELSYFKQLPISFWIKKIIRFQTAKKRPFDLYQNLWELWKKDIPSYNVKQYDVAVSYMDGYTNYFVTDKVSANKKYLWVHSDYDTMPSDRGYDYAFFRKVTGVVTISQGCRNSLTKAFPSLSEKIHILENITDPEFIKKLALSAVDNEQFNICSRPKIISVGRMTKEKGYPLSIQAAGLLRDRGYNFDWFVIGDGKQRAELENTICQLNLSDHLHLLGIQANPYYFLKNSTIFVQSSSYEGKSIAIDEAKIFNLPIVVTDFATVHDAITDGVNGIIVSQKPESIADGIAKYLDSTELRERMKANLQVENVNNLCEINKYISLFEQ